MLDGTDIAAQFFLSQLREQREALEAFVTDESTDPCWFDHHGYCQAHGPGPIPCHMQVARDLLALAPDTEEGTKPRNFGEVLRELGAYDPDLGPAPDTEGEGT